jgi:predicted DNA-binding protein (UPF0251 family)
VARPPCCRRIAGKPVAWLFEPSGVRAGELEEVTMTLDEFEAIRLADVEGLYHEQAAGRMKVSRPTFSRIVDSAHRKVASALVHGKALRIEGGAIYTEGQCAARRPRCGHPWDGSAECCRCRNRDGEGLTSNSDGNALKNRGACRVERRKQIETKSD